MDRSETRSVPLATRSVSVLSMARTGVKVGSFMITPYAPSYGCGTMTLEAIDATAHAEAGEASSAGGAGAPDADGCTRGYCPCAGNFLRKGTTLWLDGIARAVHHTSVLAWTVG